MHSYHKIIEFRVTPIRHRQKWDRRYFTAVATGGHSRLISHPAALLRWKQLKRRNEGSFISLSFSFSLSHSACISSSLLKSLLYSDVFVINYTIWDHYSDVRTHTHTHSCVPHHSWRLHYLWNLPLRFSTGLLGLPHQKSLNTHRLFNNTDLLFSHQVITDDYSFHFNWLHLAEAAFKQWVKRFIDAVGWKHFVFKF